MSTVIDEIKVASEKQIETLRLLGAPTSTIEAAKAVAKTMIDRESKAINKCNKAG